MECPEARERLRRAAPADDREAEADQCVRRGPAEHAQPHDADRAVVRGVLAVRPPDVVDGLRHVFGPAPVVAQHVQQHELGHAGGQQGIDDPGDRYAGRQLARVAQQVVDAGAQRKDRLQIGIALEVARLWLPDQRELDVGDVADIGPHAHFQTVDAPRQLSRPPVLGVHGG